MPVQQQMGSFAKKYGVQTAQAHAEHAAKPIDTGNRRLPPGIREGQGIAKLSLMYLKEQTEDGARTPKGEVFFRATATVVSPREFGGVKTEGMTTQVVIPMCDIPAKKTGDYESKPVSFNANYYEFQNIFKFFGIVFPEPPIDPKADPTGQLALAQGMRAETFYVAAMKSLTDPAQQRTNPKYVSFSTRRWTPPTKPGQKPAEEITFETWHGLAQWNGQVGPGGHVTAGGPPPTSTPAPRPQAPAAVAQPTQATPVPAQPTTPQPPAQQAENQADEVARLVEAAMADPEGATDEGAQSSLRLEQMAWAAGWTKEQTKEPPLPFTNDWAGVGDMVLSPPDGTPLSVGGQLPAPAQALPTALTIVPDAATVLAGSRWMFAKRTKTGEKLKNNAGEPYPPREVEVTSVDAANKTCTLKTVSDGKDVVDFRTKALTPVKWEWLESNIPY
jgi:hypothetical protein